jgi:multimeric flavodoxin WrbA
MSRKIVILDGSPRKKGNTSALAASFAEGARSAGNEVTEFFLAELNIHGCRGCGGGHSSRECPCVQKDDMAAIYPKVKEADVIVLASPLYYWTVSGQLKTAIDRMFALEEGDGQMLLGHGKAGVLLMAAAGDAFEDAHGYFDHLMEHLQWKNLGSVLAGGNMAVGDIAGKPELQKAYDLGASIR